MLVIDMFNSQNAVKLLVLSDSDDYYGVLCQRETSFFDQTPDGEPTRSDVPKPFHVRVVKLDTSYLPEFFETKEAELVFDTPSFWGIPEVVRHVVRVMRNELAPPPWFPEEEQARCV